MKLTIKMGILISAIAFILGGITLYKYFIGQIVVQGFLTLSLSIWFLSGLTITTLGILGLYIGKIFDGVKKKTYLYYRKTNKSRLIKSLIIQTSFEFLWLKDISFNCKKLFNRKNSFPQIT